ncbi:MAG: DUF4349 domain-containing protein [Bacteroidota bacterium]
MRSLLSRSALLVLVVLSLGAGCAESASDAAAPSFDSLPELERAEAGVADDGVVPVSEAAAQQPSPSRIERQLIKTGRLSLRVDDYDDAIAALRDSVARFEAYLAGEQEQRRTYRIENTVTVRVAAADFDAMVEALTSLARTVESRSVNVQDVTEEFVDVQARLRSRRAAEERYLAILQQASDLNDVLAVQRQLDQVREEIERVEGRLRYLRDRVGFGTLTVTLFEETEYALTEGPGFFSQVADAFVDGWRALLDFVLVALALWPFVMLLVGSVWLYRRWRRRNPRTERPRGSRRKQTAPTPSEP